MTYLFLGRFHLLFVIIVEQNCATKLAIYLMYREKKTCDDIMPNPFQNNTLQRRRHDDCHHNTHSSLIEGGGDAFAINFASNAKAY